ncbi:ABC transporter ATP-binding protein, partial [Streptomyces sp. NPDC005271]|uniref:ABC transporter ATP-binding protein n=1 Tax=Streptomyces sp. NPDC005271 TaxID=3157030 RepID=UPI00339E65A8
EEGQVDLAEPAEGGQFDHSEHLVLDPGAAAEGLPPDGGTRAVPAPDLDGLPAATRVRPHGGDDPEHTGAAGLAGAFGGEAAAAGLAEPRADGAPSSDGRRAGADTGPDLPGRTTAAGARPRGGDGAHAWDSPGVAPGRAGQAAGVEDGSLTTVARSRSHGGDDQVGGTARAGGPAVDGSARLSPRGGDDPQHAAPETGGSARAVVAADGSGAGHVHTGVGDGVTPALWARREAEGGPAERRGASAAPAAPAAPATPAAPAAPATPGTPATPAAPAAPGTPATPAAPGTPATPAAPAAPAAPAPGPGIAGALAGMPATPDLLAKVAALPPATDTPDVDEERAARSEEAYGLRQLLRGFGAPLLGALLLVSIDAIAGLLLPVLIRYGIDQGVQRLALGAVWSAAGLALFVVLAQWAAQIGETRLTGRTGERVLYALRVKIFAQLQRLGLDYYERELSGKIMTRMTTDVDALSTFLQTGLVTAVVSLLTFFGILVALLVIDVELALVVFLTLPPLILGTVFFRRKSVKAYELARERVSVINADLQESVAGLRIVQAFRREGFGRARFAERSDAYRRARVRGQWLISVYFPFVQLLSSTAAALVLIVGAGRVGDGTLSAGALVAYLLYIDLFFAPVQQLSQVFDGYQQATVSLGRIQELLREPTTTPVAAAPREVRKVLGEVTFEEVRFRYGDGEEALAGVDLTIPAGQTVAFVGETGAGKSTLVKLVARFYDPTEGAVRVDGKDLRELDLTAYRNRLGVVPQEPYLFPGTVRDAIAYGRPDASDAEVEAAARAVGAHAMVASLDGGYLHPVSERGRNLSAGQRQLIALARAELVNPDILLLDEATAALDLATEALVNQATDRLAGRRTTLVVAHRLTTAARADRVVVLDHGLVVEDGTHEELVAREGRYAALWRAFTGEAAPVGA